MGTFLTSVAPPASAMPALVNQKAFCFQDNGKCFCSLAGVRSGKRGAGQG